MILILSVLSCLLHLQGGGKAVLHIALFHLHSLGLGRSSCESVSPSWNGSLFLVVMPLFSTFLCRHSLSLITLPPFPCRYALSLIAIPPFSTFPRRRSLSRITMPPFLTFPRRHSLSRIAMPAGVRSCAGVVLFLLLAYRQLLTKYLQ